MPTHIIIAALSYTHVIGTPDGMPWQVPEEYAQYLAFTRDQTVIMGRRTWEIFGQDLRSRHTLVVSRSLPARQGIEVYASLEAALEAAGKLGREVFIAGGASIYRQSLSLADRMYLSFIKGQFEGTAYFPAFDLTQWKITQQEEHPRFEFVMFENRKNN
ncbi:MAG: hypothetical protein D6730_22650 [Bacteroidetes bacterium]|nr:MAG: hypothetical protein D6730_22650 [Bacteroidota bacterium]